MVKLILVTKSELITTICLLLNVIKMVMVTSVTGKSGNVPLLPKTNGDLKLVQKLNLSSVPTHSITMSVTVKDIGLVPILLASPLMFSNNLTPMTMKLLITSMESILNTYLPSKTLVILMVMVC